MTTAKRTETLTERNVKSTAEDLQETAASVTSSARETAERASEAVSARFERASEALRDTAKSIREGNLGDHSFGQLAASLVDASEAIREKDFNELSRDAKELAHKHPLLLAGGAAAAGFVIARLMAGSKAGS